MIYSHCDRNQDNKVKLISYCIVIPCYNGDRFLRESIISALSQTYAPIEIFVVDDGSTDETYRTASSFADKVHLHRFSENKGKSSALNWAIERTKAESILILDSDDILMPDCGAVLASRLRDSPACGIAFGHASLFNANGVIASRHPITDEVLTVPYQTKSKDWRILEPSTFYDRTLTRSLCPVPATLIRAECYREVGPYNERVPSGQDWEMFSRLASKFQFSFIDQVLVKMRKHEGNLSSSPQFLYERLNGKARAIESVTSSLSLTKEQRVRLNSRLVSIRLQLARVLIADGRCREARTIYEEVKQRHSVGPPLRWRLASCLPSWLVNAVQSLRGFQLPITAIANLIDVGRDD
ncbi:glycosyltransferase family 2 protein [Rhodopirellula sp. SWK7]|uniref:glycosyltransferase family 2 protein n=1 Tax=Rhodopirellula sp. SWK7 TaxID=595460 RepID=UPI0002BE7A63|nr:glycosyltransferase protein [Rhodopirellula sp. SWK7]